MHAWDRLPSLGLAGPSCSTPVVRGRVEVHESPTPLGEIATKLETSRAQLDDATSVALTIASTLDADRMPARGQPDLTLEVPAGSLVVGLALLHDSVLRPTPADRVLNRNVRGLLRGLRAQYFGSEHLVIAGQPIAWVGFDHDESSRVLLVAVVGVEAAIATAPPTSMRGRSYASLREVGEHASIAELVRRVIAGHEALGATFG